MRKILGLATAAIAALTMSGCASFYVGNGIKEVPVQAMKPVAEPKPVQFVFEFQTKGVPNPRATNFLKQRVTSQVNESKLFSLLSTTPVEGAGLLKLALNNVPISNDAAEQGFMTGLTFGLAGSNVIDGYECTLTYLPAANEQAAVHAQAKHALITTMGATATMPEGLVKAANIDEAIYTITNQIVSNVLNDLSHNPDFNGAK